MLAGFPPTALRTWFQSCTPVKLSAKTTTQKSQIAARIASARRELAQAVEAERIAATASFAGEPVANVGGEAWRILYEAARRFVTLAPVNAPDGSAEHTMPQRSPTACRMAKTKGAVRRPVA